MTTLRVALIAGGRQCSGNVPLWHQINATAECLGPFLGKTVSILIEYPEAYSGGDDD